MELAKPSCVAYSRTHCASFLPSLQGHERFIVGWPVSLDYFLSCILLFLGVELPFSRCSWGGGCLVAWLLTLAVGPSGSAVICPRSLMFPPLSLRGFCIPCQAHISEMSFLCAVNASICVHYVLKVSSLCFWCRFLHL